MSKRIIILGDSFTFGHGCSDREYYYDKKSNSWVGDKSLITNSPSIHAWPSLLQKQYPDIEVINLAVPGRCNQALFRDLSEYYIEHGINNDDIVIFNGTFNDRIEISNELHEDPDRNAKSWCLGQYIGPEDSESEDYKLAKKLYLVYLYSDPIGRNQTLSAMLGSYGYAKAAGATFLWSLPVLMSPYIETIPQTLIKTKLEFITEFDFSGVKDKQFNKTCRAIDFHVNDLGHAMYFEKQILPVIEGLLNKA